jgi:excisionase family DNA binding protein
MLQRRRLRSLGEYLTVKEAAALLGVSTKTLRNWDRAGKFKPRRHPVNGYRLYRNEELQALLEKAAGAMGGGPP